jgi:hypothetical protein
MTVLLSTRGSAQASESKTVRLHPFDVPAGVDALSFRFDFGPRTCKDPATNTTLIEAALAKHASTRRDKKAQAENLEAERAEVQPLYREINNLMNAVLIDPEGRWRGRWDRNPASEEEALLLTRGQSSKGFLPGEITPGRWTIAVEFHGVFGPPANYEVRIDARGPLTDAEKNALGTPAGEGGKRVKRPRRGKGWYFGEMHSHTVHSDGRHELFDLAERGAAVGIDFICLTDHNTTSGLLDLEDLPLTIVPGCELTTFHGHHPVYGTKELLPWHESGAVLSLKDMAPKLRQLGAVISVAHPFRIGDPICTGCRMPDGLDPADFDCFEVWYRKWNAPEIDNEAAYALWNQFWERGRRVTAIAARDWHGPSQEGPFPGPMAFTGVHARDDSWEGIVDGLRRGEVILSGGPIANLTLIAEDGSSAPIGGTLRAEAAAMRVELERMAGKGELRIYRSGKLAHSEQLDGDGVHELKGIADRPGWYRAEVWRDDLPRVITNHVVLE